MLDLLEVQTHLWIYRCNQRRFCGDFIAVDMSEPRRGCRRVHPIELKQRAQLKIGSQHWQLTRFRAALQEIATTTGAIEAAVPVTPLLGDSAAVAAFLVRSPDPPRGRPRRTARARIE